MTQGTAGTRRQRGTARRASKTSHAERKRRERKRAADTRPLLSINETAAYLGVHRQTVYRLIDRGLLSTVRVGTRQRLYPSDLDEYLRAS